MPQFTTLAIDLDGTTLRDDKTLSPRTRGALVRAQQRGMRLIIASGRPPQGIRHVADELRVGDFGGYVLAYNGGELWKPPLGAKNLADWQLIDAHLLPHEVVGIAYRAAKDNGLEILTYHRGEIIAEDIGNKYVQRSQHSNRLTPRKVSNFVEATHQIPLAKCMVVGDPNVLQTIERPLAARLRDMATVFRSEPFYLEIVPRNVDKGQGLARLLQEMGESPGRLIACGDAPNDIPMLCLAGLGVAMGNAQPAVKAAADVVCGTNEEDGVAQIAEKYWLGTP